MNSSYILVGTLKNSYTPPFENFSSRVPRLSASSWYPTSSMPCEETGIRFILLRAPFRCGDSSRGRFWGPSGHSHRLYPSVRPHLPRLSTAIRPPINTPPPPCFWGKRL